MAFREAVRRRCRAGRSSRSRTTSDFEILRPRDSASMSAASGSGSRTVRVFMNEVYYKWQVCKTRAVNEAMHENEWT